MTGSRLPPEYRRALSLLSRGKALSSTTLVRLACRLALKAVEEALDKHLSQGSLTRLMRMKLLREAGRLDLRAAYADIALTADELKAGECDLAEAEYLVEQAGRLLRAIAGLGGCRLSSRRQA